MLIITIAVVIFNTVIYTWQTRQQDHVDDVVLKLADAVFDYRWQVNDIGVYAEKL